MYATLQLAWSPAPNAAESAYRTAGLVRTKGTIFLLPPPLETLRFTFNAPPRPKTRMSSGAVALCKHFERGGASSEHGKPHPFWTLPVGSNENKSAIANAILEAMLEDAQWRNVMLLHTRVAVYEIRNSKGYGMRWTLEIEDTTSAGNVGMITCDVDEKQEHEPREEDPTVDDDERTWVIKRTTFRGFLEPIAELNI